MANLGVQVAIIRDDKILLIQREDFQVWGLPGGEIDSGETASQAAIREAKEETGFDVQLTRMVGLYVIPELSDTFANDHIVLFASEIIGGELIPSTSETLDARFFALDNLPQDVMWHHNNPIRDALSGIGGGVVRVQHVHNHIFTSSRADLYRQRDESDLSPVEFFNQKLFVRGEESTELEG